MPVNASLKLAGCGLYAITDGPRRDLVDACGAALAGGAALLQYRDKSADHARRRDEAARLAQVCAARGKPLIVNDDVALAATVGAGVHLGEHDTDIAAARATLGPDAIIGVSCYNDLDRARAAAAAGADYLAFGAFFPSQTKPQARRADTSLLLAARAFGLPLVAIGGITADNAPQLIAAGADFVAVVSDVFGAADIEAAARRYLPLFPIPLAG